MAGVGALSGGLSGGIFGGGFGAAGVVPDNALALGSRGFYAQHEQAIAFGASLAAGTALSIATWGIAAPEVAAALGVEATGLGIIGTAAVGAISGAAGGAGSGFVYGAVMGESPSQIAQSAGVGALSGGLSGGIFGGGFGAAGVVLDNALALGSRVTAAFGQSYATSEEWASLLASRYGAESVSGSAAEGGTSVIGHFPQYVNVAQDLGANYFSVPTEQWNAMSEAERWAANQKFLDAAVGRGDTFRLATSLSKMREGSYLAREVQYLKGFGYAVSKDGTTLIPPTKP